ncbi:MAG: NAD(P)/FAD-dependent oxidoreductase [Candidatus Krumholzibacteria bacterium]|nr:NAD(P)/FAD-dependent oxidoreductase [Candidatus Krumholzibacteria bacterium]
MSEREVIIVGAGPAGAAAAAALAARGHDVLLLDRQAFPRDKPCGDGVPPGTIEMLNDLGMAERIRGADFHPVRRIRLGSPWGRTWETGFAPKRSGAEFYIAPRVRFDALVLEHARAAGAEFALANVRDLVIDADGRVRGVRVVEGSSPREIRARVVVGADGASSMVARGLRGHRRAPAARGVAIRAYVDGLETLPDTVEFYFSRPFVPGYAWAFPLGARTANVGVIMPAERFKRTGRTLRELLDAFLAGAPVRERLASDARVENAATWQLSYAPRRMRRAFDGALLVGDAGAFVDPLTGEGIHNALVSARIAADTVHEALARGDTSYAALSAYDARCEAALGRILRRARRVERMVAAAPWALEALFVVASANSARVQSLLNRMSTDFVVGN